MIRGRIGDAAEWAARDKEDGTKIEESGGREGGNKKGLNAVGNKSAEDMTEVSLLIPINPIELNGYPPEMDEHQDEEEESRQQQEAPQQQSDV